MVEQFIPEVSLPEVSPLPATPEELDQSQVLTSILREQCRGKMQPKIAGIDLSDGDHYAHVIGNNHGQHTHPTSPIELLHR